MADLHVPTIGGMNRLLAPAAVDEFRCRLRGEALCPGEGGYDTARQVWSGMIDRRPAVIARCCEWFVQAAWLDPADDERNIRGAQELAAAMAPYTTGQGYVNYLGPAEGEAPVWAAYGPHYTRLVALKNSSDPMNRFRLNPNIQPTV